MKNCALSLSKKRKTWYNIGMCEILAPAGDEKSFYAAIDAGADAVYLGLSSFSARQSAENFCPDNLKKYIDHAHALHVRVYVAMNTLVKDVEMESFVSALVAAHNSGADAIIMQDIFLGKLIKDHAAPFHAGGRLQYIRRAARQAVRLFARYFSAGNALERRERDRLDDRDGSVRAGCAVHLFLGPMLYVRPGGGQQRQPRRL